MNHTATINIWKQTNRVSRLWEDLAANCVAPDPWPNGGSSTSPPAPLVAVSDTGFRSLLETGPVSAAGEWEERPFVERVGRESIHLIKHALEILTAPPEADPAENQEHDKDLEVRPALNDELETTIAGAIFNEASFDPFPAMVKVPFEPEPQPTSAIETRRMYYGLKIPLRPLHKRPIYQRVFYCLRRWIHMASGKRYDPS